MRTRRKVHEHCMRVLAAQASCVASLLLHSRKGILRLKGLVEAMHTYLPMHVLCVLVCVP